VTPEVAARLGDEVWLERSLSRVTVFGVEGRRREVELLDPVA
jgi:hypothetical protein